MENNKGYNETPQGGAGFSIASMVLGICSIVLCCVPYISGILAIIGLILSIVSLKGKNPGKGMAIAGLITSIVGIILVVVIIIMVVVSGADYSSYYNY